MSAKTKAFFVFLLIPLWVYLRGVYRDRLGAFGCFDDCFNIVAGYFIGQGKHLYSEIFFNHQPLMAYFSWAIQQIYEPQSIYELILRHRMVLIYFFALADVVLVLRFGVAGFLFSLLYETTKAFVFGERFLAESVIVYPVVYLFGLLWQKKRYRYEPIAIAVAAWFIVFSREPYIPLSLLLLWCLRSRLTIAVFILLSAITILFHDIPDYWWNVISINAQAASQGLSISAFTYPVSVFFGGTWNLFRWIEVVLSIVLLVALFKIGFRRAILVLFLLTLSNIRPVEPGTLYYAAFHHLVYYALLIVSVLFLWKRTYVVIAALAIFAIASPGSYIHEKVDRTDQFGIGYGHYIMQGEIIRRLADPAQTLFLEEWDDLIYWQAKLPSAYGYSWYTSWMRNYAVYRNAREDMFQANPPDFYYGQCDSSGHVLTLPLYRAQDYAQLTQSRKPLCIFVKKRVIEKISDSQWISVHDFSIDKPELVQ